MLPSEAEWTLACVGPDVTGEKDMVIGCGENVGEYCHHKKSRDLRGLCRGGLYLPNAYGLYDMLGLCEHYVRDLFHKQEFSMSPIPGSYPREEYVDEVRTEGEWAMVCGSSGMTAKDTLSARCKTLTSRTERNPYASFRITFR